MKENKKLYLIVGGVICLLIIFLVVVFIINKGRNNNVTENNNDNVNEVSCGDDCVEYKNLEMDTKHTLKYTDDLNIEVNVFSAYEYENSNISINVNGKEIYNVTDFTTYVKIFEFEDVYVVEYVQSQSQCGNRVDILIKKDGTLLGIAGSEYNDTFNYSSQTEVITPTIMKTEFNDNNDTIVVYKEMCAMCSNKEQQTGFKYTYSLEDGNLIFKNKENIYCNN